LILAGIIQDDQYFEQQIKPHLDGEQVRYVGSVGPAERNTLLGGAYALLHLISFDEPFGLSMVEAMACGTPVIAYPRGSVPEIIRHGATGYIVGGVAEAVAALVDVGSLDRASIRAHVAARFSRERMVEGYLRVYETVVQQRSLGAA